MSQDRAYPFPYSLVVGTRPPLHATLRLSNAEPLAEPSLRPTRSREAIHSRNAERRNSSMKTSLLSLRRESLLRSAGAGTFTNARTTNSPLENKDGEDTAEHDVTTAVTEDDISKFPFRLPRLLEAHQRRLALQEKEKQNPHLPHTRIVVSNFSGHIARKKPPEVEMPKDVDEDKAIQKKTAGRRRRRSSVMTPVKALRFGGDMQMAKSANQSRLFERRLSRDVDRDKPASAPSERRKADSTTGHGLGHPSKLTAPNGKEFPPDAPPSTHEPSSEVQKPSRETSAIRRSNMDMRSGLATSLRTQSSMRSTVNIRRRMWQGHGPATKLYRKRRRKGPSDTPAREEQLLECQHILEALEQQGIYVQKEIIERAILRPEEIYRMPPPMPLFTTPRSKKSGQGKSGDDVSEDEQNGRPPGRRSLFVRPATAPLESLSDLDLSRLHSAKINTWWTRAELKMIRAKMRRIRELRTQGLLPPTGRDREANPAEHQLSADMNARSSNATSSIGSLHYSTTTRTTSASTQRSFTTNLPYSRPWTEMMQNVPSRPIDISRRPWTEQTNLGRPLRQPITVNEYAARRCTSQAFQPFVLPVSAPQRPRSAARSVFSDSGSETVVRRRALSEAPAGGDRKWGVTLVLPE